MNRRLRWVGWLGLLGVGLAGCTAPAGPEGSVSYSKLELITHVAQPPVLIYLSDPYYPTRLREAGVEGTATLTFVVTRDGRVADVKVEDASEPEFGEAAKRALVGGRFGPGKDGWLERCEMRVTVFFEIE